MKTSCDGRRPAPCDVAGAERGCIATVACNQNFDALFEMRRTVVRTDVIEFTTIPDFLDRLRLRQCRASRQRLHLLGRVPRFGLAIERETPPERLRWECL